MSTRILIATAACLGTLGFAGAASAATITVDPAAPAGCSAGTCKTIGDAHTAAVDGDTISIKAGTYGEPPLVITKQNLVIAAAEAGKVIVTSSSTTAGADVITLGDGAASNGAGTILRGLLVRVQANGGRAVHVRAAGTRVEGSTLLRQGDNNQDFAVYEVADTVAGSATVTGTIILNDPAGADRSAPAVQGGDASTLAISDTLVAAGVRQGDAIALTGNATGPANTIVRTGAFALGAGGDAVSILSAGTSASPKQLFVDSSFLSAGANGAGLRAESTSASTPLLTVAGDITARLVHTTIAGSAQGVAINAAAGGPALPSAQPRGSIDVDVDRSILHGASTVANHDGTVLLTASNTARLDITNTDTPQPASSVTGSTVTVANTSNTADNALFVNPGGRNFHLRADAPVIDKGGPVAPGESDRDFDGEPRVSGGGSDLGADEFVNKPPTARIALATANPKEGQNVTLDASKSTDPEAGTGGRIAEYRWTFGDGSTATTNVPTVQHAYAKRGSYSATVVVVDNFGAASAASEPVTVIVGDGTGPRVVVATPRPNQRLAIMRTVVRRRTVDGRRVTTRSRVRRAIRFFGTATDDTSLRGVAVSLRRVSVTRTRARRSQTRRCTFYDGRSRFTTRSCSRPPVYRATVKEGGIWAYRIPTRVRVRPGVYELTVTAIDGNGNASRAVKVRFRFV